MNDRIGFLPNRTDTDTQGKKITEPNRYRTDTESTESTDSTDSTESTKSTESTDSTQSTVSTDSHRFLPILTDIYRYLPILIDSVESVRIGRIGKNQ